LNQPPHPLFGPAEDVLEGGVGAPLAPRLALGDVRSRLQFAPERVQALDELVSAGAQLLEEPVNLADRVLQPVARALQLVDAGDDERLELALADEVRAHQPEQDPPPPAACPARR